MVESSAAKNELPRSRLVVHIPPGAVPVPPGDIPDGIESYVYDLTKALAKHCQVAVIDVKGWEAQKTPRQESGARFLLLRGLPFPLSYEKRIRPHVLGVLLQNALAHIHLYYFAFRSGLRLMRLSGKYDVQIVHAHSSQCALSALLVRKLMGGRFALVYDTHSALAMEMKVWKRTLSTEFLALSRVDHVITRTNSVKVSLAMNVGIGASKISVIRSTSSFSEKETSMAHVRGPGTRPIVLSVGRIDARKNQKVIVSAVPQIVRKHPGAHFVLVGSYTDNPYLRSIRSEISRAGIAQNITFTGAVTHDALVRSYLDAKVFLFTSKAESQGVVVIEAMKFGLPIIASNIPPIREIASECPGTIVLVNESNEHEVSAAVTSLLDDDALLSAMSDNAFHFARKYNWDSISAETFELYAKLTRRNAHLLNNSDL